MPMLSDICWYFKDILFSWAVHFINKNFGFRNEKQFIELQCVEKDREIKIYRK